jgi:hypothetical protein
MIKFRNALPPTGRRVFYTLFRVATALGFFLALASCAREEVVPEAFTPNRSHADYTYALEQLGLAGTPIGAAWLQAGNPLENYRGLSLVPLEEFRSFAPDVPDALWFLLEGVRGQRISIEIETESDAGYFADVIAVDSHWDPREDGSGGWDQVGFIPVASAASMDPLPETDSSEPDAAGTFSRPGIDGQRPYRVRAPPPKVLFVPPSATAAGRGGFYRTDSFRCEPGLAGAGQRCE